MVAKRYPSPVGEIDLVATNGERLAFVEMKRQKTQADAAFAVTAKQKQRIACVTQYWLSSHPSFVDYATGFNVILCAPWSWPRHVKKALPI
jgi:putative endonuclease